MAALTTIATVAGAVATGYAAIKGAEAAQEQAEEMKKQQKRERKAIAEAKAAALEKRKTLIKEKRRQIFGAGDDAGDRYRIGQTGAMGVLGEPPEVGETLTGRALG